MQACFLVRVPARGKQLLWARVSHACMCLLIPCVPQVLELGLAAFVRSHTPPLPKHTTRATDRYTLQNYAFAHSLEPHNVELAAAVTEAKARRAQGLSTVPSTIGKELATNPFMRVQSPAIQVTSHLHVGGRKGPPSRHGRRIMPDKQDKHPFLLPGI